MRGPDGPEESEERFPTDADGSFAWLSLCCRWNTLDFRDRSLAKLSTRFTFLKVDSSGELSGLQREVVAAISSSSVGVTGLDGAVVPALEEARDLPNLEPPPVAAPPCRS